MLNDNHDDVAVEAKWVRKTRSGYTVLEIKITNNTGNTKTAPEITIDLSNINYNHNEDIIASEGFKRKSLDQTDMNMIVYDRITGTPCDAMAPHSTAIFQLGFLLNTKNLTLPTQFWFNSEVLCNDAQQPSVQENDRSDTALLYHEIEPSSNNSDWLCKCLGFGVPENIPY